MIIFKKLGFLLLFTDQIVEYKDKLILNQGANILDRVRLLESITDREIWKESKDSHKSKN